MDHGARLSNLTWQKESNSSGCPSFKPGLTALYTLNLHFHFECFALFKVIFDLRVPEGISTLQEARGLNSRLLPNERDKSAEADLFL